MAKKITISGEIGWDVTSQSLADQFRAAKGEDIDIDIASPGGDVFTGIEIYNLIRDYKRDNPDAQILMTLKGLGASMAVQRHPMTFSSLQRRSDLFLKKSGHQGDF